MPKVFYRTSAIVAATLVFAVFLLWKFHGPAPHVRSLTVVQERPQGVMGTSCTVVVVVPSGQTVLGEKAIRSAVAELRRIESLMSEYLTGSEISRLNAAQAGTDFPLSPESLHVLRLAHHIWNESGGAFDATCSPLIHLWREAAREDRLPSPLSVRQARSQSEWGHFEFLDQGIRKNKDGARLDLGGIAKGWAIDRAVSSLKSAGCAGGLVDVGGDLRTFGTPPSGSDWPVKIRNPFREGIWGTLVMAEGAVCTSGDYARFVEIQGRRYSHIIDPRTGEPAKGTHSVTVVAPTAATADGWATALSVLGPEGFRLLPADAGIDVLIIQGEEERPVATMTTGFEQLLAERDYRSRPGPASRD